jgi:hypothetical protein
MCLSDAIHSAYETNRQLGHCWCRGALMVSTIGLWVEGYRGQLGYARQSDTSIRVFQNVRGGFQYGHAFTDSGRSLHLYTEPGWYSGPAYSPVASHLTMGFGTARIDQKDWHFTAVVIPAWRAAMLFSITPFLWSWRMFSRIRQRNRVRAGARSAAMTCANPVDDARNAEQGLIATGRAERDR